MAAYQDLKLYIETYSSRPYILMGHFKISEVFPRKITNVYLFLCYCWWSMFDSKSESINVYASSLGHNICSTSTCRAVRMTKPMGCYYLQWMHLSSLFSFNARHPDVLLMAVRTYKWPSKHNRFILIWSSRSK